MTDPPPPKGPRLGAAADVADVASAAAATAPGAAAAAYGATAMAKVAAAPSTDAAAPAATAMPTPGAAAAAADGAPAGSAPAAAMAADTAVGEGGAGGGDGEGSPAPPPSSKLPRRGADADVAAAAAAAAPAANGGAPAATTGAAAATPAAAAAAPSAAVVVDDAPAKGDGAGARAPPAPPPSAASADGAVAEAAEGPAVAADDGGRTGDAGAVAAAVGSIGVGGGAAAAPAGAAAGTAAAAAPSAAPSEVAGAGTTPGAAAPPPPPVAAKDAAVVAPPPAAAGGGGDAELHREAPVAAAYIVAVRKHPDGTLELNGGRPLYDAAAIDELSASSRVVHPAAEAAEAAAAEAAAAAAAAPVAPVAAATDGEAAAAAGGAAEADTAAAAEGTPAGNGSGAAPVPVAVAGEAAPAVAAGTAAVTPQVTSVNAAAAPAGATAPPPDAAAPAAAAAAAAADAAAPAASTDAASPPAPSPPPGTKAVGFLHRDQAPDGSQSNFLSQELQVALRRRKVPFPRTAEVLKTLAARPRDRHGAVIPAAADGGGREPRAPRRVPDLTGKLYLAPLKTVGNTPFRRLCKGLGADVTCGEMALAANILQGQRSEWALLRRHAAEDVFGVQLAGNRKDVLARAAEVVARECAVDFVDLNCGCPLDMLTRKGAGAAMIDAPTKLADVVASVSAVVDVPLSVKLRTGRDERRPVAHTVIPALARAGASWFTVHGRSRTQRYSRLADWDYLTQACAPAAAAAGASLIPNGDVYAWEQAAPYMAGGDRHGTAGVSAVMIARGALIKPWLFTECAQRRHWDISATERLGLVADFARYGLDHWGADGRGREKTRKFLLEWLSFAYRYVPLGLLESPAGAAAAADAAAAAAAAAAWGPRLHHRSPVLRGRSDLETLLASPRPADWVRISELVLGAAPAGFTFSPKHGSHAWAADEVVNG